jgi:predicted permease
MKQQGTYGNPRFPLRGVLLGVQVAISVVLLVAAGLLTRGLVQARQMDPGFQVSGVALLTIDLPVSRYDDVRARAFFRDLMQRLGPLSASGKVGFTALAPLGNGRTLEGLQLPGQKDSSPVAVIRHSVNPDFFDVLGIPLLAGRNFAPGDAGRHAVLINETMAQRYWPNQNPLGQRGEYEIVGVVRDAQLTGLGPVEPAFFRPSDGGQRGVLVLRGDGEDRRWIRQISAVVKDQEPRAVISVVPIAQQMDRWLGSSRMAAAMAAALGGLALLLAAVGVYGVVAYSVEQRRREIGVRMALGARSAQIVGFVAKSNSRALAVGLAVGLLASLGVSELLQTSLYGISRLDPVAYGGVVLVLLAAGLAASIVPARRAAAIAPLEALHYD